MEQYLVDYNEDFWKDYEWMRSEELDIMDPHETAEERRKMQERDQARFDEQDRKIAILVERYGVTKPQAAYLLECRNESLQELLATL